MSESMRRKKRREEVKRHQFYGLRVSNYPVNVGASPRRRFRGVAEDAGVTEESDSDSFEGRKGFKASRKP
jgi:hypothetical protein